MKVQLAQAELQVVTLQDTLDSQKENLNDLLGRDVRTKFRPSAVPRNCPRKAIWKPRGKKRWETARKFGRRN